MPNLIVENYEYSYTLILTRGMIEWAISFSPSVHCQKSNMFDYYGSFVY